MGERNSSLDWRDHHHWEQPARSRHREDITGPHQTGAAPWQYTERASVTLPPVPTNVANRGVLGSLHLAG